MSRRVRLATAAVVLGGAALRLYRLGAQSLWYDEGYSIYLAGKDLPALTAETAADIQPPLYYYLLHFWTGAFGTGETAARALSALFAVLALPLFYVLGRRLFGRRAGLLAAGLAALSPLYVWYAQEARMYALLVWLTLAASWCLWLALHEMDLPRRRWWWAGWALTAALALYTHYFAVFVLAFHALFVILHRPRTGWREPGLALLAVLVAYLPWMPHLLVRYGADASYWEGRLKLDEAARKIAISFSLGESVVESVGGWLALGFGLVLLIGLVAILTRRSASSEALGFALLYLIVPVALLLGATYASPKFSARYAMAASPALFLLLGAGLDALWRSSAGKAPAFAAGAFLVGAMCFADYGAFHDVRFTKPDFRGAARWVAEHRSPDETVILSSGHAFPVFDYYYGSPDRHLIPADRTLDAAHVVDYGVAAELNRILAGKAGVWLVLWQDEVVDPNGYLTTILDLHAEPRPVDASFYHVRLRRYALPAGARFPEQPEIDRPLDANFGNQVKLLGCTPALTDTVLLYWQALTPLAANYKVSLRLKDAAGHDWQGREADARLASDLYPTRRWQPGEIVLGRHRLPAAPGTPAGLYRLEAVVYADGAGQPLDVLDARGAPAGKAADLGLFETPGRPASGDDPSANGQPAATWGDEAVLRAPRLDRAQAQAGDQVNLSAYWQAGPHPPRADYAVRIAWFQGERELGAVEFPPTGDAFAPTQWKPGDLWLGQYRLDVPLDVQPGPAEVRVALVGSGDPTWKPVGAVDIQETERVFEAPPLSLRVNADFDGKATLLGANLSADRAEPGQVLTVTLYWKAISRMEESYTGFVHLLDGASAIRGQVDRVPAAGTRPTTGWVPGEVIEDRYELTVSPEAPPGDYLLEAGLYDGADPAFPRLPVVTAGQPPDSRALIGRVVVAK